MKRSELIASLTALHPLKEQFQEVSEKVRMSLPSALTSVAADCFVKQTEENVHTQRIRAALLMLEKDGVLTFDQEWEEPDMSKPIPELAQKYHHLWCNYSHNPREGCKFCERAWRMYPYETLEDVEGLAAKYFPDAIPRPGT